MSEMKNECKELSSVTGSNLPDTECPSCHYTIVNNDNFYVCPCCGRETCSDCGGRCGCEIGDED